MRFFDQIPETPSDPIFGLAELFKKDPRHDKVFFGIGVYRNASLEPVIMHAVKEAEKRLIEIEKDKEYLPISGDGHFLDGLGALAFGQSVWDRLQSRIASVQTVGGTGALRLGADFLKAYMTKRVAISDPSWPNHKGVFSRAGFDVSFYPYYDFDQKVLCFEKMIEAFDRLEPLTVLLFQMSCHNPTGMDLSFEQWKEVAEIIKRKNLIPFFDCPYQGFGDGLEKDLLPLSLFIEREQELLIAYSCSKNFSIYNERVGALFIVTSSQKERVFDVLKALVRNNVSNPPAHGAKVVAEILGDKHLKEDWKKELKQMKERIALVREQMTINLGKAWIAKTKGIFCMLHLEPDTIEYLREEKAIYIALDSRINLAALNQSTIERLVRALQ